MRTAAVALAVAAALLVAAPVAGAATQTASSGPTGATLTYTPDPGGYTATGTRIAITRAGVPAYDAPVGIRACRDGCAPLEDALTVRDLDGDADPEVVVTLTSGGAHCCTITRILRWDGARYVSIDRNWGDRGYTIEDLEDDGHVQLVTSDDRFAYLYGSYAASVFPLQVFALQAGRLADVTRLFGDLVRKDRAENWRLARRTGARTAYAAWAADRYLLDEIEPTLRTLRSLAARGKLRTDLGDNSIRGQRRWVDRLDRDLRRFGYAG